MRAARPESSVSGYGSAAVRLRCVYTDLDGTLLGRYGSLFRDSEGEFSMMQARAVEACHRAGVEIVIKSGRREAQVLEDARLIGQRAYIYEVGCGVVIDGEKTVLVGEAEADPGKTLAQTMVDRGVPDLLFDHFEGRLEWHYPWHQQREHSLLVRGKIDVAEANELIEKNGHRGLRLIDNGAIVRSMEGIEGFAHAYHLLPGAASKANAVAFHMRARGYAREECIAVGDSVEDLDVAEIVGHFFVPANGPERDLGLRDAIAGRDNVTVTEGQMGDGFYEAVVSTLAKR
jgi:phosphoglycolate phosphatase